MYDEDGYPTDALWLDWNEANDYADEANPDEVDDGLTDAEADHMTLVGIGWGSDEDYGYYGE